MNGAECEPMMSLVLWFSIQIHTTWRYAGGVATRPHGPGGAATEDDVAGATEGAAEGAAEGPAEDDDGEEDDEQAARTSRSASRTRRRRTSSR